jgi:hypothetical protein
VTVPGAETVAGEASLLSDNDTGGQLTALLVSLAESGSCSLPSTDAVFAIPPRHAVPVLAVTFHVDGTAPVTVIAGASDPASNDAPVHVSTPDAILQPAVVVLHVIPDGSVSLTTYPDDPDVL